MSSGIERELVARALGLSVPRILAPVPVLVTFCPLMTLELILASRRSVWDQMLVVLSRTKQRRTDKAQCPRFEHILVWHCASLECVFVRSLGSESSCIADPARVSNTLNTSRSLEHYLVLLLQGCRRHCVESQRQTQRLCGRHSKETACDVEHVRR